MNRLIATRLSTLCGVGLILAACQQTAPQPDRHDSEIADLRTRIQALEQGQNDIVREIRESTAKTAATPTPPPSPVMTYQLEGGKSSTPYPSKARCEAAREIKTQADIQSRAEAAQRGVITVVFPTYTCVPL